MIEVGDIVEARGRRMKVMTAQTGSWSLLRYFECQAEHDSRITTLYEDEVRLVRKARKAHTARLPSSVGDPK